MQKIGIWGLGIMGTGAVRFFAKQNCQLSVFDQRSLSEQEQAFLSAHDARYFQGTLFEFLEMNDKVLASCTIDLRPYDQFAHKWLSELDLFYHACTTPIIAITGSVGKTTITHLLSQLLIAHNKSVFTGGNIGVSLLDCIDQANRSDYVIVEVSSFQLERSTHFCPHFAIISNIHPNHLDRHGTFDNYQQAKFKIMGNGTNHATLLPFSLLHTVPAHFKAQPRYFFSVAKPSDDDLLLLGDFHTLYYLHNDSLMSCYQTNIAHIIDFKNIPLAVYLENVVILASILTVLDVSVENLLSIITEQQLPAHRLHKFAHAKDIVFYDDSKSTIPAATLAALEKIKNPVVLYLGGVSKGLDRCSFISQLPDTVKFVYCFGKEATQLKTWCDQYHVPAVACATLEETFTTLESIVKPGDHILFSPAGASYDLFKDYKERGECFKKLVHDFIRNT